MTDAPGGPTLSIVVPAYNEELLIGDHLRRILAFARDRPWSFEVLVVDDGSDDATAAIVGGLAETEAEISLVRLGENRGKGYAVRHGLASGRGSLLGFTDADASTDIAELDRLLPAFEEGARVVIGSRALVDPATSVRAKLHRRLLGRVFNAALRGLLDLRDLEGRPLADTQCGFKWLTADAAEALLPHASVDGFAFDVELLYVANRLGLPIREVAVNWTDRGASSVDLLRDPIRMLASAYRVARRHRTLGA